MLQITKGLFIYMIVMNRNAQVKKKLEGIFLVPSLLYLASQTLLRTVFSVFHRRVEDVEYLNIGGRK